MAMLLKRENALMSVKVTLEFWIDEPKLTISFEHGGNRVQAPWELLSAEAGVPMTVSGGMTPELTLPTETLQGIKALADQYASFGNEPLWLHLVPPYGYSGLLPWEQVLGDATGRPILRLPDFLERSREDPHTLVAAIVYDPSAAGWPDADSQALRMRADDQVRSLVEAALAVPRDRVIVHLFTTVSLNTLPWLDRRIRVHRATEAPSETELAGGSPWLEWIARELEGRSPDVLHFVCGANLWDQTGALLLRGSPASNAASAAVSALQPSELASFMTRIGAWAAMVSPLAGSTSDSAWRYFADCLALLRPGPSLMAALGDDRTIASRLYGFVLAPLPTTPPALGRSFLYCQPALVAGYGEPTREGPPAAIRAPESVLGRAVDKILQRAGYQPPSEPSWTSTAQRYVEKSMMDVQRIENTLAVGKLDPAQFSSATSANSAVTDTLRAIQQIIDQQGKPTTGGDR